jgi:hypothetical protein
MMFSEHITNITAIEERLNCLNVKELRAIAIMLALSEHDPTLVQQPKNHLLRLWRGLVDLFR